MASERARSGRGRFQVGKPRTEQAIAVGSLGIRPRTKRAMVIGCLGTVLTLPLSLRVATASCGLEFCPPTLPDPAATPWNFQVDVRQTSFDFGSAEGNYTTSTPQLSWSGLPRVDAGAYLPVVALRVRGEETETGLGNAVLFAEGAAWSRPRTLFRIGAQFELATGDADRGLAADHTELLGYLRFDRDLGASSVFVTLGHRTALGGHHHHTGPGDLGEDGTGGDGHDHEHRLLAPSSTVRVGSPALHDPTHDEDPIDGQTSEHRHATLYVAPHEDAEAVYRVGWSWQPGAWVSAATLSANGQYVTSTGRGDRHFASLAASVTRALGGRYTIEPGIEIPVTAAQRFDLRVGLAATLAF